MDIVDPKDSVNIMDIVNMVNRLDMMHFDIVTELGAQKFHKCPSFLCVLGALA